jgi:hypothetical protein
MLAGWLFADLLLVLFITAFASLPPPPVVAGRPATPKPPAVKHTTPPPKPRVLERSPHTFTVNVPPSQLADPATRNAAVGRLLQGLRQQLAAQGLQGRQAGFVLVFAYGPIGGIGQAISTANDVVEILRTKMGTFGQASGLGYWTGNGDFQFKIFFYAS